MKRFFVILLTAVVLITILASSVFASTITVPEGYGKLTDKIIYWQHYASESVDGEFAGYDIPFWNTFINLPKDSYWEVYSSNSTLSPHYFYTDTREIRFLCENPGSYYIDWYTPYYISLEDLSFRDHSKLYMSYSASEWMYEKLFLIYYYDSYMNQIGYEAFNYLDYGGEASDSTFHNEEVEFRIPKTYQEQGARYLKFCLTARYDVTVGNTTLFFTDFKWIIGLPVEFNPDTFAVDGIDAWMNGYYEPIVPDIDRWWDEAAYPLEEISQGASEFANLLYSMGHIFTYYVVPLAVAARIFNSFISISWLSQILTVAATVGLYGTLLSLTMTIISKASKSSSKKSSKGGG